MALATVTGEYKFPCFLLGGLVRKSERWLSARTYEAVEEPRFSSRGAGWVEIDETAGLCITHFQKYGVFMELALVELRPDRDNQRMPT